MLINKIHEINKKNTAFYEKYRHQSYAIEDCFKLIIGNEKIK